MSTPSTILFLAADPETIDAKRLQEESEAIDEALQRARHRDAFHLKPRFAVTPTRFRRALLDTQPRFVHFCGPGLRGGIMLEGERQAIALVSGRALEDLFKAFDKSVECVLLSACYSSTQARAINRHIRYVIGMKDSVDPQAAIAFATGFYDAIGAGLTVPEAFALGKNAPGLAGLPKDQNAVLKVNEKIPAFAKSPAAGKKRGRSTRKSEKETASTVVIKQTGSGGIAYGPGSVAVGKGGVGVKGNVSGGIRVGGGTMMP